jgi:hypothetical protein
VRQETTTSDRKSRNRRPGSIPAADFLLVVVWIEVYLMEILGVIG